MLNRDAFVYPAGFPAPEEGDPLRTNLIMRELREALETAHPDTFVLGMYEKIARWYPVTETAAAPDFGGFRLGDPADDEFILKARKD